MKVSGSLFYIRSLFVDDISDEYLSWLRNEETNKFLEVRFNPPSRNEAIKFLNSFSEEGEFFCGVYGKSNDQFIGTVSMRINSHHKVGTIGLLIGDRSYWGTTASIESLALALDLAFLRFNLRKVCAGAYENNIGSSFTLKTLGFTKEGVQRAHYLLKGKPQDSFLFGILRQEWMSRRKEISYTEQTIECM